eukprot:1449890-Amphidinium_carterae.1
MRSEAGSVFEQAMAKTKNLTALANCESKPVAVYCHSGVRAAQVSSCCCLPGFWPNLFGGCRKYLRCAHSALVNAFQEEWTRESVADGCQCLVL